MTTYLFIGLILALAAYLVRARRARSGGSADGTPARTARRRASLRRRTPDLPPPVTLPEPAGADAPPAPAFGPRPLEPALAWEPGETIVEPGWPMPGEISGAWSPVPGGSGHAPLPQVATEPAPVVDWAPGPSLAEAPADEPVGDPPLWIPGRDEADAEPVAVSGPAWIDPAPAEVAAAEALATGWAPTAIAPEDVSPLPLAGIPAEPEDAEPAMAELAWLGESVPAEPAWLADLAATPAEPEPVAEEPVDDVPSISWLATGPEEPAGVGEPVMVEEPVEVEEPVIPAWTPEPGPLEEPAPVAAAAPAASLEDQSAAVAELVGALPEGLVPFGRVPDRLGVTPRMLALMRLLADEPRTVTEQARALGVSRAMVADLCGRLVVLGLASREPSPSDRRRALVTLTSAGRRTVADAAAGPSPADVAGRIGGLSPAERDALVSGLRVLSSRP